MKKRMNSKFTLVVSLLACLILGIAVVSPQTGVQGQEQIAGNSSVFMPVHFGQSNAVFFYVSKNGNNNGGRSWATAWNEFDQIEWGKIKPGDFILVDGGAESMTYRTPLVPQQSGVADIIGHEPGAERGVEHPERCAHAQ